MPTTYTKEHTMESTYYTQRNGDRVWVNGKGEVRVEGATHSSNPHVPAKRWYLVARPKDAAAYAARKVASGDWAPVPGTPAPAESHGHRVVAMLPDGTRVAATHPLAWGKAQAAWRQLDDQRVRGHMPHVAYYAVRSTDDPDWQGLRVDQRVVCPHPDQPMPTQRPTPHQAGVLARLVRRSTGGLAPQRVAGVLVSANELRWAEDTSCGGPAALWHLYHKGYAELDSRTGPRGGEHNYYRPTMAGVAYVARQQARQEQVARRAA